jgi:hypothetical protein
MAENHWQALPTLLGARLRVGYCCTGKAHKWLTHGDQAVVASMGLSDKDLIHAREERYCILSRLQSRG